MARPGRHNCIASPKIANEVVKRYEGEGLVDRADCPRLLKPGTWAAPTRMGFHHFRGVEHLRLAIAEMVEISCPARRRQTMTSAPAEFEAGMSTIAELAV